MKDKPLLKSKTFWGAVIGVVGALAAYFTGEASGPMTISVIWGSVMAIFGRDALRK